MCDSGPVFAFCLFWMETNDCRRKVSYSRWSQLSSFPSTASAYAVRYLDDQSADERLAVLVRREGHNELRALVAVRRQHADAGRDREFEGRVAREEGAVVGEGIELHFLNYGREMDASKAEFK